MIENSRWIPGTAHESLADYVKKVQDYADKFYSEGDGRNLLEAVEVTKGLLVNETDNYVKSEIVKSFLHLDGHTNIGSVVNGTVKNHITNEELLGISSVYAHFMHNLYKDTGLFPLQIKRVTTANTVYYDNLSTRDLKTQPNMIVEKLMAEGTANGLSKVQSIVEGWSPFTGDFIITQGDVQLTSASVSSVTRVDVAGKKFFLRSAYIVHESVKILLDRLDKLPTNRSDYELDYYVSGSLSKFYTGRQTFWFSLELMSHMIICASNAHNNPLFTEMGYDTYIDHSIEFTDEVVTSDYFTAWLRESGCNSAILTTRATIDKHIARLTNAENLLSENDCSVVFLGDVAVGVKLSHELTIISVTDYRSKPEIYGRGYADEEVTRLFCINPGYLSDTETLKIYSPHLLEGVRLDEALLVRASTSKEDFIAMCKAEDGKFPVSILPKLEFRSLSQIVYEKLGTMLKEKMSAEIELLNQRYNSRLSRLTSVKSEIIQLMRGIQDTAREITEKEQAIKADMGIISSFLSDILNLPRIKNAAAFIEDDALLLVFDTDKIIARVPDGGQINLKYFGRYRCTLNLDSGELKVKQLEAEHCRRGYWSDNDPHPHISSNGDGCLGTLEQLLAFTLGSKDYTGAVYAILEYLSTANTSDGAGKNYVRWDSCDEDGNITALGEKAEYRCAECDDYFDEDSIWRCEHCGADYCEEHICYMYPQDYHVCDTCRDEYYWYCKVCDTWHKKDDAGYTKTVCGLTGASICEENSCDLVYVDSEGKEQDVYFIDSDRRRQFVERNEITPCKECGVKGVFARDFCPDCLDAIEDTESDESPEEAEQFEL